MAHMPLNFCHTSRAHNCMQQMDSSLIEDALRSLFKANTFRVRLFQC